MLDKLSLFKKRFIPEFNATIPCALYNHFTQEGIFKNIEQNWRLIRREFWFYLSGQKSYQVEFIPVGTKRILWLSPSLRNIGDAIMALSARELLVNYQLDLLTDSKNYLLFKEDKYFKQVFINPQAIKPKDYDLIILDTVKSASTKIKYNFFKKIPFCHYRGHFDGIEFNWLFFSYHRINALLNYPYSEIAINSMAKANLTLDNLKSSRVNINKDYLVIVIGGEDVVRRVYQDWASVIARLLDLDLKLEIVLIGNQNGLQVAKDLINRFPVLNNQVNKLNLAETAGLIKGARYFLGCDSGLMHIAEAFNLPGVSLFGFFKPVYRLSLKSKTKPLFHPISVNNIPAGEIISAFLKLS